MFRRSERALVKNLHLFLLLLLATMAAIKRTCESGFLQNRKRPSCSPSNNKKLLQRKKIFLAVAIMIVAAGVDTMQSTRSTVQQQLNWARAQINFTTKSLLLRSYTWHGAPSSSLEDGGGGGYTTTYHPHLLFLQLPLLFQPTDYQQQHQWGAVN